MAAELRHLGVRAGDALFVHASLRSVGPVLAGARSVIEALQDAVGPEGLIAMPGFSEDAYLPEGGDAALADAVPGFDPARSSAAAMGALAETFRTWPGTLRSPHPSTSVCANGAGAAALTAVHPLPFATGPEGPFGRLYDNPRARVLLIGVGWTRCTALHMAEALAPTRRLKTRRVKHEGEWTDAPDVADDLGCLFPGAGAEVEATGHVMHGSLGQAACLLIPFRPLVDVAAAFIDAANRQSGDRA